MKHPALCNGKEELQSPRLRSEVVTFLVRLLNQWSCWTAEVVSRDMVSGAVKGVVSQGAVRLRKPERSQVGMVLQCADDLGGLLHPVRTVMRVVEQLDVTGFCTPIRARQGVAGRDATDPRLLVGLWLYACVRGIGSARELARRCQRAHLFAGCAAV